jgi:RNA polymerase sigma-70 factor (ECF subfamily)
MKDAATWTQPDALRLYDEFAEFVWRMLQRLGVPPLQVEDAVQDVFLVVYRRLPSFREECSARTWIGAIAVKVARDHRRLHRRKRAQETPLVGPALLEGDRDGGDPFSELAAARARALVEAIVSSLPVEQREVFVLAEFHEFSVPEIAQATGVGLNTTYSRLRLARAQFNKRVEEHRRALVKGEEAL